MNYQQTTEVSRAYRKWTFDNGWRLELYTSYNRKHHITLFNPENTPVFLKNYEWYQGSTAEQDALTLVAFVTAQSKEIAA